MLTQEYGRYFGLRTARLPRRLPHRARTTPASSSTASSATSCTPPLREGAVHDLRLQGEAGPRPDPLGRRDQRVLGLRPGPAARARSTTSAAARPTPPACSSASSSIAEASRRQAARRSPTTSRPGSATTSATTPTWPSSGPTSPAGGRSTTSPAIVEEMVAAVRGAARLMSAARAPDARSTSSTRRTSAPPPSWPRRWPSTGPPPATRSRSSPAGPATSRAWRPPARVRTRARTCGSGGCGRPTSASRRVARRLLGYVAFFARRDPRGCSLLPRQDVIVAMTTPPFVVVAALLHQLLHRRTRVVLWSMDCYPDAAERFGELQPGRPRQPGPARASTGGCSAASTTWSALDGAMVELLASQYAAGAGPPAVRGDPELGAGRRCSPPTPAPPPWAGLRRRSPSTAARSCSTSATRRRPPVRHRARRRRAARATRPCSCSSAVGPAWDDLGGRGGRSAASATSCSAATCPRTRRPR